MTNSLQKTADIKHIEQSPGVQNTQHSVSQPGAMPMHDSRFLEMSNVLQSTLELGKLLELFDDELTATMRYQGLKYQNKEENYCLEFGTAGCHQSKYSLVLFEKPLGEITISRKSQFNEEELTRLEILVAALIYPLRNAILYKRAIETAYRDPISGLNNRAALDNALEQEMDFATRHKLPLSAIILDIDKFKSINDSYGHIAGDAVLKQLAECMEETIRRSDILFRYGGEEFVVLLRNTSDAGAELLAERLRQAIQEKTCIYNNMKIYVTVSLGFATLREDEELTNFMQRADDALYNAKTGGRNRYISGN